MLILWHDVDDGNEDVDQEAEGDGDSEGLES